MMAVLPVCKTAKALKISSQASGRYPWILQHPWLEQLFHNSSQTYRKKRSIPILWTFKIIPVQFKALLCFL